MAETQKDDTYKIVIETNNKKGADKIKSFAENYSQDLTAGDPSQGKRADSKIELTFENENEANKFLQKAKENQDAINNLEIQNGKGQKIASLADGELKDLNGKDITEDSSLSNLPTNQPKQSASPAPKNDEKKPDDKKPETLWEATEQLHQEAWKPLGEKIVNAIKNKILSSKESKNNAEEKENATQTAPKENSKVNLAPPNNTAEQPTAVQAELANEKAASPTSDERFEITIKATEGKSLDGIDFTNEDNLSTTKNADGTMNISFNNEASATRFLAEAASKEGNSFTVEKDGNTLATANEGKLTSSADGSQITAERDSLSTVSQEEQTTLRQ